jgi:membrane fusion protein (multidrug efflux system)
MGNILKNIVGPVVLAAVCIATGWILCEIWPKPAAAAPMAMQQMAATIGVDTVQEREYNLPEKYVAHAEAMQEVSLLPQVDGYIKEISFKEGDIVKEGDVLYVLDDERYRAVKNQRMADLEAAKAEQRRADRQYQRLANADERGRSQLELDNAEAQAETAKAQVLLAEANLIVAEYDLKKTRVCAPISGQIGKSNVHVGDYVAPSRGALARIVQVDPIRVSFPLPDRLYVHWRQLQKRGETYEQRMRIILADGSEYEYQGAFDFDDNEMSRETASIMLRLKFPNPDRMLVPNSFVTLLYDRLNPPKYPSVQQSAIFDLPGGGVGVYVVDGEGRARATPVSVLPSHDGFTPVVKGLEVGQRYVTAGTRKLTDGAKVVEVEPTPTEENAEDYEGFKL